MDFFSSSAPKSDYRASTAVVESIVRLASGAFEKPRKKNQNQNFLMKIEGKKSVCGGGGIVSRNIRNNNNMNMEMVFIHGIFIRRRYRWNHEITYDTRGGSPPQVSCLRADEYPAADGAGLIFSKLFLVFFLFFFPLGLEVRSRADAQCAYPVRTY